MYRVLFLTHKLNLTGAATHMYTLGRALQDLGNEVGVAARGLDAGTPLGVEHFEAGDFKVFQAPFPQYGVSLRNAKALIKSSNALRRIIREFKPDVIHLMAPSLATVARLASPGTPLATTFNIEVTSPTKIKLARTANKMLPRAFGKAVFCISTEMKNDLRDKLGFSERVLNLIPYGVDESRFPPTTPDEREQARAAYDLPADALVLCQVAILDERKNHRLVMRALAGMNKKGKKVYALFAGDGKLADQLKAESQEMGIDGQVRWLGYCDPRQAYHASDAVILPSTREGFGLVIVEGALCGLVPIRTPSAGALDQIEDGRNGFLIDPQDSGELEQLLLRLDSDPAYRKKIAEAAQQTMLAKFTKRALGRAVDEVYKKVIKAKPDG